MNYELGTRRLEASAPSEDAGQQDFYGRIYPDMAGWAECFHSERFVLIYFDWAFLRLENTPAVHPPQYCYGGRGSQRSRWFFMAGLSRVESETRCSVKG
jgi:hypothetical protein